MKIPLVGQNYAGWSLAAAASECTNLYQETIDNKDDQAKNFGILRGIPGLTLFKDLTAISGAATPVRGLWGGGGRLFVGAGTKEFEVGSNGALIGSINVIANDATSTPVQIFSNFNQLLIISAGQAYYDNGAGPIACRFQNSGTCTTNGTAVTWVSGFVSAAGWVGRTITINSVNYTVSAVASPNWTLSSSAGVQAVPVAFNVDGGDLVTAVTGAFLDGYGLVQRPSGGSPDLGRQVNFSNVDDFSFWRGLDFFTKEAYPDYIRSILADNEQLYILGTETCEIYQTVATSATFQRIPGMFIHRGSVARYAPVSIAGYVYWLEGSSQGQVIAYRSNGGQPERVSTYAEETAWNSAFALGSGSLVPNNPVAFAYEDNGHLFWVINFALGVVSGVNAFVYDVGEKAWHQRGNYNPPLIVGQDGTFTQYAPWFHTFIPEWGSKGKHIVGDGASGKLYEMSSDVFTDASANAGMASFIGYRRAIPYRYNGGNQLYFGRQTLEMETGTVPSGAEPVITRDYSDDRGHTFANPQDAGYGTHGQYSRRVFWPTGGSSRGRVWRYLTVANCKQAWIDLQGEEVQGTV